MTNSQFREIAERNAIEVAKEVTPRIKMIKKEKVEDLITKAYYSGCINTYNQIKRDPSIIRKRIGFIQ